MRTFHGLRAVALAALLFPCSAPSTSAQPGPDGSPSTATIVVVPFANLTGANADAWIGAGIAESLATGFPAGEAIIGALPETTAAAADDVASGEASVAVRALEVGRAMGAQFVASGAYQRLGESIRITGRLGPVRK